MREGLKIPFKTKDGKTAYWWRVKGCWILVFPEKGVNE
jgi:hypothetical protein